VDSLYLELGKLVRQFRKDAGLTQTELATRVGLGRTSITNIELGQQHLSLHLLYALASALGTSPEKLLPRFDHAVAFPKVSELDPELRTTISSQQLAPSTQRWIQRLVLKAAHSQGVSHDVRTTREKDIERPQDNDGANTRRANRK
jgi:transcriptional regulator with XRE-family HTH domain